ncbi:MAG: Hsp20/alpha crystallin family protein [Spirochaetia bacterium]|nr:Hsp20/alpha crystallin family protein [Spirochaetia bacterium]
MNSTLEQTKKESYAPNVNIYEGNAETILVVDLPGVDEKGVDISFEKDILTIKGEPSLHIPEGYKVVHKEYQIGQYIRRFTINKPINIDGVSAKIKNGRVTLTLPYTNPSTKKIEVRTE